MRHLTVVRIDTSAPQPAVSRGARTNESGDAAYDETAGRA
jgi:hypothetical protein